MYSCFVTYAGVEALNLAKWPIGGHQEQAVIGSIGHMWRLKQLDLADSLVSSSHGTACACLILPRCSMPAAESCLRAICSSCHAQLVACQAVHSEVSGSRLL